MPSIPTNTNIANIDMPSIPTNTNIANIDMIGDHTGSDQYENNTKKIEKNWTTLARSIASRYSRADLWSPLGPVNI